MSDDRLLVLTYALHTTLFHSVTLAHHTVSLPDSRQSDDNPISDTMMLLAYCLLKGIICKKAKELLYDL